MKHTPYLATFIHLRGSLFTYINRKIFAMHLNMLNLTFSTHTLAIYTNTKLAGVGLRFIERLKMETVKLLGGHFSCRVTKHQINWLPCCEGEVLIGKLVVEHFAPFLSENRNSMQRSYYLLILHLSGIINPVLATRKKAGQGCQLFLFISELIFQVSGWA